MYNPATVNHTHFQTLQTDMVTVMYDPAAVKHNRKQSLLSVIFTVSCVAANSCLPLHPPPGMRGERLKAEPQQGFDRAKLNCKSGELVRAGRRSLSDTAWLPLT